MSEAGQGGVARRVLDDHPRPSGLSCTRIVSIALRTVHLAAFGLLLGGHAFEVPAERLLPWLGLTILSGLGLVLVELRVVGLAWFSRIEGVLVIVKLLPLLAIPWFWEPRVPLLLLVLAIGSVSSHLPARYRHYALWRRRAISAGR